MLRKPLLCLMILVGMIILLLPASGYSKRRPHSPKLSTIVQPEHRQKLYSGTVEIIVRFEDGAHPKTFKAWLNKKKI